MSKLDTIRSLIQKAGRLDTPVEEARSAGLVAARMIVAGGFNVVHGDGIDEIYEHNDEYKESSPSVDDDFEINLQGFEEVSPFKLTHSDCKLECVACRKEIVKGVIYARELQSKTPRVTHFHCRSFFTKPG